MDFAEVIDNAKKFGGKRKDEETFDDLEKDDFGDTENVFHPTDLNQDARLNYFDASQMLTAYRTQNPSADFNNDGNADLAVTSYSDDKTSNEIKVLELIG